MCSSCHELLGAAGNEAAGGPCEIGKEVILQKKNMSLVNVNHL